MGPISLIKKRPKINRVVSNRRSGAFVQNSCQDLNFEEWCDVTSSRVSKRCNLFYNMDPLDVFEPFSINFLDLQLFFNTSIEIQPGGI